MAMLKREDILAAKLKHEAVEVPEWGGEVSVWELSALNAEELQGASTDGTLRVAPIVAACIGDESGPFVPALGADELRQRVTVGTMARLAEVALRLNVMSKTAAEDAQGN